MSLARKLSTLFGSGSTVQDALLSSSAYLPAGVGPLPFAVIGTTYGAGDGLTTFNLPDMRGRVAAGKDNMGGTAASRLTSAGSGVDGLTLGASGGSETHTLTIAQMPAHQHDAAGSTNRNTVSGGSDQVVMKNGTANAITNAVSAQGGGGAHNNTQPTLVMNYIIKT